MTPEELKLVLENHKLWALDSAATEEQIRAVALQYWIEWYENNVPKDE